MDLNLIGKAAIVTGGSAGIGLACAKMLYKEGADILIVGRYITQSKDIERSAEQFINLLGDDIDLKRVHVE